MKKVVLLLLAYICLPCLAQDIIVKNDGSTILSKVVEVSSSELKYKKFSNLNGPIYSISLSDILSVNYENGEKELYGKANENNSDSLSSTSEKNLSLKVGTLIPIQIVNSVRAANLNIGDKVSFRVSRDVNVNGSTVIPYGTPVTGTVYKASRSSWFGTKGKLGILINNVYTPEGVRVPISNGDVYVTGTNRTALSVLLFLFVTWPACFICGSRAEIPSGYEIMANVATTTMLNADRTSEEIARNALLETYDDESIYAIVTDMNENTISYRLKNDENGGIKQINKSMIKRITFEK